MADIIENQTGKSLEPVVLKEAGQNQGITLYQSQNVRLFVPSAPNIPLSEGLHVQVSSGRDAEETPKEVLSRYMFAEASAKALAESGLTQDAWANTRIEAGQKVSVYGRVPQESNSWRKPVDTNSRGVDPVTTLEPYYDTTRLQGLFESYIPLWEQGLGSIVLFENGVSGSDAQVDATGNNIVWENDNFSAEMIRDPHIKGMHLVVHPKESFERQWEAGRITYTLEAMAIAMGVQKLLANGKGEIHNSGNWAQGLKTIEEGGKLSLQNLAEHLKKEKRSHRPDIAAEDQHFNTGMHVHVYIPEDGDQVTLPPMSKNEALARIKDAEALGMPTSEYESIIEQWEAIGFADSEDYQMVNERLGDGKLTKWLEENARGNLVMQPAA